MKPSVSPLAGARAEKHWDKRKVDPCTIVIFGAGGDLTRRKLIPALYSLARDKILPADFALLGVAREAWDDDAFRAVLRKALDGFARLEVSNATQIARFDEAVDEEYRMVLRHLITYMMEDPRTISMFIEIIFAAKAIERMGDHAKNMSEYVVYMVKGKDVRHTTVEEIEREVSR